VVGWICRDCRHGRDRNTSAIPQEAEGDAGCTGVDTTIRSNRKYRPDHRGRVQAVIGLIEKRSGARPDPPWRGCLAPTNKFLARKDKSLDRSAATKGRYTPPRPGGIGIFWTRAPMVAAPPPTDAKVIASNPWRCIDVC